MWVCTVFYTSTPKVACGRWCWEEAKRIWTFRSSLLTAWCCTINSARTTTRWPSHHKMESSGSASATSSPSWQTRWADEENDTNFAWKQCQLGQESYAEYWDVDVSLLRLTKRVPLIQCWSQAKWVIFFFILHDGTSLRSKTCMQLGAIWSWQFIIG